MEPRWTCDTRREAAAELKKAVEARKQAKK